MKRVLIYLWYLNFFINPSSSSSSRTINVCQGNSTVISCSHTSVLKILNANYGRLSATICSRKNMNSTQCVFPKSLKTVKKICEGKRHCLLRANDDAFGCSCCRPNNYLFVEYLCHAKGKRSFVAVEKIWILNADLRAMNSDVLPISYGVGKMYLNSITDDMMFEGEQIITWENIVGTKGNGQHLGWYNKVFAGEMLEIRFWIKFVNQIPSTSNGFGVNVLGVIHNDWIKSCSPDVWCYASLKTKTVSAVENDSVILTFDSIEQKQIVHIAKFVVTVLQPLICSGTTEKIECKDGNVIDIYNAWYGRKKSYDIQGSCATKSLDGDNCGVNATGNVTFLCEGTRVCYLTATDDFYGNSTCFGVLQHLEISYKCKPHIPSVIQPTKSSVTPSFDGLRLYNKTLAAGFNSIIGCVNNTVLYIHTARFGADGCYVDAKKLLTFNCNGLTRCFLSATIGTHGEPCTGVNAGKSKSLEMQYYCADKVGEDPPTPVPPLSLVQTPPSEGIPPVTGLPTYCGRRKVRTERVINGINAKPGLWPWQAAIYRNRATFSCGGSLINSNWVVTAAHCFGTSGANTPEKYTVVLGDFNRTKSEGHEYVYNVTQVIRHPQYNPGSLGTFSHNNDVALMKIEPNVGFTDYISPVCLDSGTNEDFAEKCFLTGWGKPTFPGYPSYILQQGYFEAVNHSACQAKLNAAPGDSGTTITANMLCATHTTDLNQSGCHADSGGPFVCFNKKDSQWYLRGVVSWGSARCSIKDMFQVLAKISAVREWISQTINRN